MNEVDKNYKIYKRKIKTISQSCITKSYKRLFYTGYNNYSFDNDADI